MPHIDFDCSLDIEDLNRTEMLQLYAYLSELINGPWEVCKFCKEEVILYKEDLIVSCGRCNKIWVNPEKFTPEEYDDLLEKLKVQTEKSSRPIVRTVSIGGEVPEWF